MISTTIDDRLEHLVASGSSVLVHAGREPAPRCGVLSAHARAPRSSSPDDATPLKAMANVVTTAVVRRTRGIADAHGGRVRVEARPGSGSTSRFTLPTAAPARASASRVEE